VKPTGSGASGSYLNYASNTLENMRAAYFVSSSNLIHNPSNTATIQALRSLGVEVDIYAPNIEFTEKKEDTSCFSLFSVEYGYRWIIKNLFKPWKWLRYDMFCATSEDPIFPASLIAHLYIKKLVIIADEIKSGSYSGNRGKKWKETCKRGIKSADLTIINTPERIEVLRDYVGVIDVEKVAIMPNCYINPPTLLSRNQIRNDLGIPLAKLVICYSGIFNLSNCADWFLEALDSIKDAWFWAQISPDNPITSAFIPFVRGYDRMTIQLGPLGWHYPWQSMPAADIGLVLYQHSGPQFQNMGVASNRLCMFLTAGVPVIASRQESFQFIERFDCGILVDHASEIPEAVVLISKRLDAMKANALRCANQYIDSKGYFRKLEDKLLALIIRR
jgi:hypothetical protein